MTIPTKRARLEYAAKHQPLWNVGDERPGVASWRTIATGASNMNDSVGTEPQHRPETAEFKVE